LIVTKGQGVDSIEASQRLLGFHGKRKQRIEAAAAALHATNSHRASHRLDNSLGDHQTQAGSWLRLAAGGELPELCKESREILSADTDSVILNLDAVVSITLRQDQHVHHAALRPELQGVGNVVEDDLPESCSIRFHHVRPRVYSRRDPNLL